VSATEAAAAQAHFEYMALGASVPYGGIPVGQLNEWVPATQGIKLPGPQTLNVGWLRFEAAVSITNRKQDGQEMETALVPTELVDGAQACFDEVELLQANDPLVRARAMWAAGSLGVYGLIVAGRGGEVNVAKYYNKQMEAAELVMHTARRRGMRNLPLRDLYIHGFLSVLNNNVEATGVVGLPVPTRLQEEGDERRGDILLWDVSNRRPGMFLANVTTAGSAVVAGNIVFSAELLQNDKYPSDIGQGTLQASIEYRKRQKVARRFEQKRQRGIVLRTTAESYVTQAIAAERTALTFQPESPITKLDEARKWYAGLSPLRRLTPGDAPAITQCIKHLDRAYRAGELSSEDSLMLAWLRTELGSATQTAGEPVRAEYIFTKLMDNAEKAGDWARYCEALAGKITAQLYSGLYSERPVEDVLAVYRSDLEDTILWLRTDLNNADIDKDSPQVQQVSRLLDRLTACYALTSDPYATQIGILATPRQQATPGSPSASDILVMPRTKGGFSSLANGRVRLAAKARPDAINKGIATWDPGMLADTWHSAPDGSCLLDGDALALVRARLLEAVEPVLFV